MQKAIKFILKYKGYIICVVILILSILSIYIQNIDRKNTLKVNNIQMENKEDKIAVYIAGKVKNPGVYYLDINSRLYQLLDICGGVLEDADIEKVNLAQKLHDSDKITILEKKTVETVDNDEVDDDYDVDSESKKININTASLEELKTLNGIGDATAKKIIEYRKTNEFIDIEDIMNVSGIGESKFNNIKEYISTR